MTTITELSSAHRFLIARVSDLAIDVTLAGKYEAAFSFTPCCWDYSLFIFPAGRAARGSIYHLYACLNQGNGSNHSPDRALPDMLAKLEALLTETEQEVQPS